MLEVTGTRRLLAMGAASVALLGVGAAVSQSASANDETFASGYGYGFSRDDLPAAQAQSLAAAVADGERECRKRGATTTYIPTSITNGDYWYGRGPGGQGWHDNASSMGRCSS